MTLKAADGEWGRNSILMSVKYKTPNMEVLFLLYGMHNGHIPTRAVEKKRSNTRYFACLLSASRCHGFT